MFTNAHLQEDSELSLFKPGVLVSYACNDGFSLYPPDVAPPTCTCIYNIDATASWSCTLQAEMPVFCKPSSKQLVVLQYSTVGLFLPDLRKSLPLLSVRNTVLNQELSKEKNFAS